jgi:hypothetical protein
MLPDSTNIQASHSGQLTLHPSLSTTAKTAHILDGMTNSSPVSIGQLCDDNCVAVLDKRKLQIFKNNQCILKGGRNTNDGLWDISIPLPPPSSTPVQTQAKKQQLNAIIRKDISKTQLVQYLHGCCGSPVVSTWNKAVRNGNFVTWPGIDTLPLEAHLPKSKATAMGHLDQERKNLQSTRITVETDENDETDDDRFPLPDMPNVKTFDGLCKNCPFCC